MISKEILSIIACPKCKGPLTLINESGLVCKACKVKYPITDGIPELLIEKAQKIDE
jgi:uncharacterized protein YbaR (Trm112 family)